MIAISNLEEAVKLCLEEIALKRQIMFLCKEMKRSVSSPAH